MPSLDAMYDARIAAAAKAAADKTAAQVAAATQAVVAAGGKSTDRANRLPGETATQANKRITQAYKDQPEPALTKEGAAAGATIEFVRSGAGGVGTYKEVYPMGKVIPETRTTVSSNVYDAKGTLVSGTGLKTGSGDGSGDGDGTNTGTLGKGGITSETKDAFAVMTSILNSYGLSSLSSVMQQLMTEGLGPEVALSKVKYDSSINPKTGKPYNADYTARFSANITRINKGLNAISEAEYLFNEDSYAEILKAYGLTNMLSLDRTTNQKKFAEYIANDMAPTEFKERIDLASTRVTSMDPTIKKNFQDFYPSLSNQDLISYFLDPKETLPILKIKVSAAEIGAAANQQGLNTNVYSAEGYVRQGITYSKAQEGYKNVAEVLPIGKKLSDIYEEDKIGYNQKTAEEEYLGQSAEAKLKRNRLASKERATFDASSGLGPQGIGLARTVQTSF